MNWAQNESFSICSSWLGCYSRSIAVFWQNWRCIGGSASHSTATKFVDLTHWHVSSEKAFNVYLNSFICTRKWPFLSKNDSHSSTCLFSLKTHHFDSTLWTKSDPFWKKLAPSKSKYAFFEPKCIVYEPKWTLYEPKMDPLWFKMDPLWPKNEPFMSLNGPSMSQNGPLREKYDPFWSNY